MILLQKQTSCLNILFHFHNIQEKQSRHPQKISLLSSGYFRNPMLWIGSSPWSSMSCSYSLPEKKDQIFSTVCEIVQVFYAVLLPKSKTQKLKVSFQPASLNPFSKPELFFYYDIKIMFCISKNKLLCKTYGNICRKYHKLGRLFI